MKRAYVIRSAEINTYANTLAPSSSFSNLDNGNLRENAFCDRKLLYYIIKKQLIPKSDSIAQITLSGLLTKNSYIFAGHFNALKNLLELLEIEMIRKP